ncbi:FAM3D protein, partial [Dromas ardeola]|nr:FAM3D protein [Dromas ardeola]
AGVIRIMVLFIMLLGTWFVMQTYFDHRWKVMTLRSWLGEVTAGVRMGQQPPRHKCGNQKSCPPNYFAFKIISGAANVVGPSICFENRILMSSMKNNIGRGLNIALVNGESGGTNPPSPHAQDINKLDAFLQEIKAGTIVLTASYDDPATKMNDKVRAHFVGLGSNHVKKLGFRDNWVFLGAKGLQNKSPFEEYIKNDRKTNKYDGWPEMLEMEGCAPKKMH